MEILDTVIADKGTLYDIFNHHFVNIASSLAELESASLQKALDDANMNFTLGLLR